MKVGDLVRVYGTHDWATHRVVEGSRQCPLYVKHLDTGVLSPMDETKYEVVEPAERIAERLILGWEQYIPVLKYEVAKGDGNMVFQGATFRVEYGEGIFGFILPGYQPTTRQGMVFLKERMEYKVHYGKGAILVPGSAAEVISGGAKPNTIVAYMVEVADAQDDRKLYTVQMKTTMR